MTAQAIALNEIEWRSDAVAASAGRAISNVATHTLAGIKHLRILNAMSVIRDALTELLRHLHTEDSITALENATPEQRIKIATKFCEINDKVRLMFAASENVHLGYWKPWYTPKLNAIKLLNSELVGHSEALKDTDAALIILSKKDQEFLLEAILNPKEPSEDFYRVFARK
jgi:hypothetical protein